MLRTRSVSVQRTQVDNLQTFLLKELTFCPSNWKKKNLGLVGHTCSLSTQEDEGYVEV